MPTIRELLVAWTFTTLQVKLRKGLREEWAFTTARRRKVGKGPREWAVSQGLQRQPSATASAKGYSVNQGLQRQPKATAPASTPELGNIISFPVSL